LDESLGFEDARFVRELEDAELPDVVVAEGAPVGEVIDHEIEFIGGIADFAFVVFPFHPEVGDHDFVVGEVEDEDTCLFGSRKGSLAR
jgi:hypothetical protein